MTDTWSDVEPTTAPVGGPVGPQERSRFTRRLLLLGSVPLLFNLGGQVAVSLAEDDDAIWMNVSSVAIASLLFGAIAFALAQWAMRGSSVRQVRTVVGLAVLTVLLVPVGWWSSAPLLVGLQAWLLGQVTGVGRRPHGSPAARAAGVVAVAVAVGLLAFVLVIVFFEALG